MLATRSTRNVSGLVAASSSTAATPTPSRTATTMAIVLNIDPSVAVANLGTIAIKGRLVGAPAGDLLRLGGRLAVDHPWGAELVDDHAEARGPERLLDRHPHGSVVRQCMKDALRLRRVLNTDGHGETVHFLEAGRGRVGAHQDLVAQDQPSVHDLVAPFGRHVLLHGRAGMRHHGLDLAAEHLLIEFESGLAASVEIQVGIQLHGCTPCAGW